MSDRYDIRWDAITRYWEIVDTANGYAPTGQRFRSREQALRAVRRRR